MVNSEVEKRRAALQKRLENVRRWAERARVTHERFSKRYNKRGKAAKAHGEEFYRDLNPRIWAREERHDLLPQELHAQIRDLKDAAKEEMDGIHDRALNRDLAVLCAKVGAMPPQLPDGRRLIVMVEGTASATSDAQTKAVA